MNKKLIFALAGIFLCFALVFSYGATWNADKPAVGNQISEDIPDIEENFQELHDVIEAICDGTLGSTEPANFAVDVIKDGIVVYADLNSGLKIVNIWIPANAFSPTVTNGAFAWTNEYATNDVQRDYLAFDGATEEYGCVDYPMPENWNRGTVKAKIHWSPGDAACSAGDKVEWELKGVAVGNDDAIDTSYGTSQVIYDTVLAGKNGDLHISGATPAITIGGTPALGDELQLKLSRNVGSANDTMTEDAWFFGVFLQITISESVTAW